MRYAGYYITKLLIFCFLLPGSFVWNACRKENPVYPVPSIDFNAGRGFLSHDTTLLLNDTIQVGVLAATNSDQELIHFHATVARDTVFTSIDTALFTNHFTYSRRFIKGMAKKETWAFYVRDRFGRKSREILLSLMLDSASIFGNVKYYPSVILGAQSNPAAGSFFSLAEGKVLSQSEAFNVQRLINLVYYFDLIESDGNTLASPGANIDASFFPGPNGIYNWQIKNTTRFMTAGNIDVEEFDSCRNDSLILANTFEFESGKRKAKNLEEGQVCAFVTDSGIKGLFKVSGVRDAENGTIEISIKIKN